MTQEYCRFQHASGRWVELSFDSPPEEVIESGEPDSAKSGRRAFLVVEALKSANACSASAISGAKSFANLQMTSD